MILELLSENDTESIVSFMASQHVRVGQIRNLSKEEEKIKCAPASVL